MTQLIPNYSTGVEYELPPAGTHLAICYSMIHIGRVVKNYGQGDKTVDQVRITWELCDEKKVFNEEEGEKPFSVSQEYTFSLSEKAKLRQHLESWRGKAFTEDQARNFDMSKLLGVPCMLSVIHKKSQAGREYTQVSGISTVPKRMQEDIPERVNPLIIFSWAEPDEYTFEALPEFLQNKLKESEQYRHWVGDTPTEAAHDTTEEEESDLPF